VWSLTKDTTVAKTTQRLRTVSLVPVPLRTTLLAITLTKMTTCISFLSSFATNVTISKNALRIIPSRSVVRKKWQPADVDSELALRFCSALLKSEKKKKIL